MKSDYTSYLHNRLVDLKADNEFLFSFRRAIYAGSLDSDWWCKNIRNLGYDVMDYQQFKRDRMINKILD